jgi:hypothetical protein
VGRLSLRASDGEVRRIRRTVIVLLILSVAGAILLAVIFRFSLPATVVSLLVGGGAPAGLYMTWRQTVNSENQGDPRADGAGMLAEPVLKQLAKIVLEQWDKEVRVRTFNDPAQKLRDIKASWSAAGPALTVDWPTLVELAHGPGAYKGMQPRKWARNAQGLSGLDEDDLRDILEQVPTGWLVVRANQDPARRC